MRQPRAWLGNNLQTFELRYMLMAKESLFSWKKEGSTNTWDHHMPLNETTIKNLPVNENKLERKPIKDGTLTLYLCIAITERFSRLSLVFVQYKKR